MAFTDRSVFVYGTLKPGGRYWPQFCEGKVSAVVPARVQGELYDLRVGYPGFLRRGSGWVQGFVLTFPREADFAEVDRLEGYSPTRPPEENEYSRLKVECFGPKGGSLGEVWTYVMSEPTIRRMGGELIEDGLWRV